LLKITHSESLQVAFLFGFDGVLLNQLRQQTGAGLTLTDPHSHEQVLSISGTFEPLFKAFSLVCRKLWDFLAGQGPLVLRLAVPASQCGSIIGKHGAKVLQKSQIKTNKYFNSFLDYKGQGDSRSDRHQHPSVTG
jgi:poly(rC)-binding protein 2/3/4